MTDHVEIRGGAGEMEAAVIAVVLDSLRAEEAAAEKRGLDRKLSAWARAGEPDEPDNRLEFVRLDD